MRNREVVSLLFRPKIIDTLKTYSREQFKNDLSAGVVVGIVALPLAIAFAIASGVSPDKGIITAIVAGFLISVFGGSRVQIGGPTGAFVVIVYSIVHQHGIDGLLIATILGGVILCIMGLAGLGAAIKYIPYPVIVGFTSGIAVIIFTSQIKDFLGLDMAEVPPEFFEKWYAFADHISTINGYAAAVSVITVVMILWLQKISKKIPGSFLAIIVTTFVVQIFALPVETIGSRFGAIPTALPAPHLPSITWESLNTLLRPALTIALLAGIESLLSAVVSDGMIGGKHRSNTELIAQGAANIAAPLFGGIPATGAIARTALNVHSGGRTPVAGIVHALTVLVIILLFGQWASLIPLSALAGILVIVAYRMGEWHSFALVLKSPRSDAAVLLSTFFLTVIFDLTVAIEVGIVLAALLFIRRVSMSEGVKKVKGFYDDEDDTDDPDAISRKVIPEGVEVYEINGPFFFGIVSTFMETVNQVETRTKILILRMRHVSSIDATALHALNQVIRQSRAKGVTVLLSGVGAHLLVQLERYGVVGLVTKENILPDIDRALLRARELQPG